MANIIVQRKSLFYPVIALSEIEKIADDIIDEVVELQYKEKEILYIFTENNKQRVFVPIEDE